MELADLLHAKRFGWAMCYGGGSLLLGIAGFLLGVAMRGELGVQE
jgi:fluoride ion exporter CrcB/FEX